jgi:hypothetical protein
MSGSNAAELDRDRPQDFRNFLLACAVVGVLVGAGQVALNMVVDPYGAWDTFGVSQGSPALKTRTAKAELLRHFDGETVLIGSSRVRIGYNTDSPLFEGTPACNMGLDAMSCEEMLTTLELAVERPKVHRILLFLDFRMFNRDPDPTRADYLMSRFNPQRSMLDYHCDLLLNAHSFKNSCKNLKAYLQKSPATHSASGYPYPEYLEFQGHTVTHLADKTLEELAGDRSFFRRFEYSRDRLKAVRTFIHRCEERKIELTLAINPVHATLTDALWPLGLWDQYQNWTRDLVTLVERETGGQGTLWDFTAFNSYTDEPLFGLDRTAKADWYWEPSHFKSELGEVVLARMLDASSADPNFGVKLTSASVETHLMRLAEDRLAWRQTSRTDAANVARITGKKSDVSLQIADGQVSRSTQ